MDHLKDVFIIYFLFVNREFVKAMSMVSIVATKNFGMPFSKAEEKTLWKKSLKDCRLVGTQQGLYITRSFKPNFKKWSISKSDLKMHEHISIFKKT